jgi:hypothetical protein
VPVTFLNPIAYHSVPEIEADRLHVSLGNSPVVISKMEKTNGNRILLLIDISGSQGRDAAFLQNQIELLLEKTPAGSPIAYGFFNDRPLAFSGFLNDPKEVSAAAGKLRSMKMEGHTALFDALHEALKLFQPSLPGDSILILSDGGENHSKIEERDIVRELKESGVRVFAILQPRNPVSAEEIAGPEFLNKLVRPTGGAIYNFPTSEFVWSDRKSRIEVVEALRTFWLEGVGSGYLLTMSIPTELKKDGGLKIRLDKGSDTRLKNVTVFYPRQLAPCIPARAAAH